MSKDAQENPWPGFVDVLSSTLLVFVFLVVIQLLVIAGVSMKVSQTVTEKMLQELLREAEAKGLTITETEVAQIKEKSSNIEQTVVKEKENPASLEVTKDKLAIVYKGLSTLLENDDSEQVDQWIKDRNDLLRTSDILLNAYLGSPTLSTSTSYYVSYNRMMDIRKRLVLQGVPGDHIKVRIHDSDQENHNKVELWILESTP